MGVKFGDIFLDPNDVCESEYRAVHECISLALFETECHQEDRELSDEEVEVVEGMLSQFAEDSRGLLKKLRAAKSASVGGGAESR